jgi:glucose/arabinose dehydrogenase
MYSPLKYSLYISLLILFVSSALANNDTKCSTKSDENTYLAWEPLFPSLPNIDKVTSLVQAPNDDNYWYATHQPGKIFRFKNDVNANKLDEVLNIKDRVDDSSNEMGLLGITFHPSFPNNPYVYLNYTGRNTNNEKETRISRFEVSTKGSMNPKSELILLRFNQPYSNHNGGDLTFGKDGYLYIATGDGGSGGDPQANGQNTHNLLGKILRINVDKISAGKNYTIPTDNPFAASGGAPEIYAYGLRNPWRISFDKLTSQLWVADVGQNTWEEVNLVERGGNYGWGDMEGEFCFSDRPSCSTKNKILPLASINHTTGVCSITGGFVYRGAQHPKAQGKYFFTDYCLNIMKSITLDGGKVSITDHGKTPENVVTFAQSNQGEIYAVGQSGAGKQIAGMVKKKCGIK